MNMKEFRELISKANQLAEMKDKAKLALGGLGKLKSDLWRAARGELTQSDKQKNKSYLHTAAQATMETLSYVLMLKGLKRDYHSMVRARNFHEAGEMFCCANGKRSFGMLGTAFLGLPAILAYSTFFYYWGALLLAMSLALKLRQDSVIKTQARSLRKLAIAIKYLSADDINVTTAALHQALKTETPSDAELKTADALWRKLEWGHYGGFDFGGTRSSLEHYVRKFMESVEDPRHLDKQLDVLREYCTPEARMGELRRQIRIEMGLESRLLPTADRTIKHGPRLLKGPRR